jgi:hypothetical protein
MNPSIRENEDNNVTSHNQCGVTKCNINHIYNTLRNSSDAYNTTGEKKTHKTVILRRILGSNIRQLQT